jgi:hypothetical protein
MLQKMAQQVRAIALCRPLLIAVDGLNLYPTVFRDAFRMGHSAPEGADWTYDPGAVAQYCHCSSDEI